MTDFSSYYFFVGLALGVGFFQGLKVWPSSLSSFSLFYGGAIASSWLGAKTFFFLFSPSVQESFSLLDPDFWAGGGFVFYGGLLSATAFIFLYETLKGRGPWIFCRAILPTLTLGHGIGRFGCFFGGCCYGRPCHLSLCSLTDGRIPVPLLEAIFLFVLTAFLHRTALLSRIPLYLFTYGLWRFGVEFFRGDAIRGLYWGFSTSQYISAVLILAGTALFIRGGGLPCRRASSARPPPSVSGQGH